MRLRAPFRAAGDHIGARFAGARVLFSTRRGGVSGGPYQSLNVGMPGSTGEPRDDPDAVAVNRDRLAGEVGVPWTRVLRARQVHGAAVLRADSPRSLEEAQPEGDGQATANAALAVAVLVADCLPVALVAPGAVAMLHCGWRGLAGGIVDEGVRAMRELGAEGPVAAAIGPGAGGCCYEVGAEVLAAFGLPVPADGGRRTIDLKAIAQERLNAAGVAEVHDVGLCTICSDRSLFFSHRRDRGVTGRQAGLAWLN